MPIYEYQCNYCNHQLEIFHKRVDEKAPICPKCQKTELNRLISSTSFQLKGNGWYVTDFKDKKGSKPEEGSSKPADNSKPVKEKTQSSEKKNESASKIVAKEKSPTKTST